MFADMFKSVFFFFVKPSVRNYLNCGHNCDVHSLIHSFDRSSNECISYISLASLDLDGYITNTHEMTSSQLA